MQENSAEELLDLYLSALKAEIIHEQESDKMLHESNTISEAVSEGLCCYPVQFIEKQFNAYSDQLYVFSCREDQETNEFKLGRSVEIFNSDGSSVQGQLAYNKLNQLTIKCQDEELDEWVKQGKIGLKALSDSKTYELYVERLNQIKALKDHPYYDFFKTKQTSPLSLEYKAAHLNDSQNYAVNHALSEHPFTIIHGPPGTGKTTTLLAAIKKLQQEGKKVTVCSPSNAAIDHIVHQLLKDKLKVCRLGNELKVDEKVKKAFINHQIQESNTFSLIQKLTKQSNDIRKAAFKYKRNFGKEEFEERKRLKQELKKIRTDIRKLKTDLEQSILEEAQIICGTFHAILNAKIEKADYLIIDEAGQAIAPAIWSIADYGEKLILAGDHFQLPATVKSDQARAAGLEISLLELAEKWQKEFCLLNVQYRMNSGVAEFSNRYFYQNKIQSHTSNAGITLANEPHAVVEFIDTAGCGFEEVRHPESGVIYNLEEINILHKRIEELPQDSIAIITPYRAQLNKISEYIQHIDCNTIDSFQGQERDIIVISLCRCNESNEIGFLKDYRRMNVAFTRARKKLIVVGDSITTGNDPFYKEFLQYIEDKGSYRSAWEFMN